MGLGLILVDNGRNAANWRGSTTGVTDFVAVVGVGGLGSLASASIEGRRGIDSFDGGERDLTELYACSRARVDSVVVVVVADTIPSSIWAICVETASSARAFAVAEALGPVGNTGLVVELSGSEDGGFADGNCPLLGVFGSGVFG